MLIKVLLILTCIAVGCCPSSEKKTNQVVVPEQRKTKTANIDTNHFTVFGLYEHAAGDLLDQIRAGKAKALHTALTSDYLRSLPDITYPTEATETDKECLSKEFIYRICRRQAIVEAANVSTNYEEYVPILAHFYYGGLMEAGKLSAVEQMGMSGIRHVLPSSFNKPVQYNKISEELAFADYGNVSLMIKKNGDRGVASVTMSLIELEATSVIFEKRTYQSVTVWLPVSSSCTNELIPAEYKPHP